jgi:hypothetical protein
MEENKYQQNIKSVIEGLIYTLVSERPRNVVNIYVNN